MSVLLGIDIGGTKTALVRGNERLEITDRIEFPTLSEMGAGRFFENLLAVLDGFLDTDPTAIGISVGGPVDPERGIIYNPRHLPWGEVDLKKPLNARYGCPVNVEHDAKAGAVAEFVLGAGMGFRNMVFLTLGTGLGAGIIIDGTIYRGYRGFSGEIGHMKVSEEFPYRYGRHCGGDGIAKLSHQMYPESFLEDITCKELGQRAHAGDVLALEVLKKSGSHLGHGLAVMMDMLDPDRIVLGGLSWRLPEIWLSTALAVAETESMAGREVRTRIVKAALGEKIGDFAALVTAHQVMG